MRFIRRRAAAPAASMTHCALGPTADDRRELAGITADTWSLADLLTDYPRWDRSGMADPGAAELAR